MAWRQPGSTGSNNIPLGTRRRFGGGGDTSTQRDDGYNSHAVDGGYKRGRSPTRGKPYSQSDETFTDLS